jgi:hypothetical protein
VAPSRITTPKARLKPMPPSKKARSFAAGRGRPSSTTAAASSPASSEAITARTKTSATLGAR